MSNKNDDNKYQVKSTDEYGIKTTKGGQKYLICSFINDNLEDKYTLSGVENDNELCTSILLQQDDKQEYLYEPFNNRAIGYVIGNYNKLIGFSVTNASTDTKGTKNLEIDKPESEFIGKLSDNLRNFKPYKIEVSNEHWELLKNAVNNLENGDQLTLCDKLQKISEEYWNKYQAQSKYKALSDLIGKSESLFTRLQNIALAAKVKSVDELKNVVVLCNKQSNFPENNQMNINGAKIKSMIINITNLDRKIQMTDKIKADRLKEIVLNINDIIDIQFNKLGHKSILVRDAETKKIQKMKLHKFVDYIRDECKKSGIDVEKVNKNYPTSKEVHKKTQGFWCKIKSFFGFNHHDHNNAYASYDANVIKNDINTMIYSNM